jgi:hypothetical protein
MDIARLIVTTNDMSTVRRAGLATVVLALSGRARVSS